MKYGKTLCGYEGYYMVSSFGRLKSLDRWVRHVDRNTRKEGLAFRPEKILRGSVDGEGYLHTRLVKNGISELWKIHQIVATAFLGYDRRLWNPRDPDSIVVHHINSIKTDNRVENLALITSRENIQIYHKEKRHGKETKG